MNNGYQRKFNTPPQSPRQQPRIRRAEKRPRRRSIWSMLLMLIGAATILVLLMRYAIVPLLVMLPAWLGGAP